MEMLLIFRLGIGKTMKCFVCGSEIPEELAHKYEQSEKAFVLMIALLKLDKDKIKRPVFCSEKCFAKRFNIT